MGGEGMKAGSYSSVLPSRALGMWVLGSAMGEDE